MEQERSRVDPEAHAVLQKYFAKQPERIRALVNARHVEDLTAQQTADLLGISRTRVNQLEDRMLEELRQLLHRAGIHSSADRLTPSPGEPKHG